MPDRFAIADINGDGRNDIVVTEEMGPAVPEANTYWFEQPANPTAPEWPRHTVATQFTTNAMDVADIDRDGDPDIITGEHRGTKKVIIWENPGDGSSWTPHLVSEGKESHLGARVVDLDGDGDLDIVSICWDAFQDLHLWRNDARAGETSREVDGGRSYLAGAFKYRLPITVGAAGHERFDKVIELDLNFTQLARQLGEPGAFDETSLHVVEVNARGDVSDAQVMFQFDKSRDFDSESKALGTLVLMLEGTTPADGVRRYEVYWGRTEGAWVPPSVPEKVSVTDGVMDEGYESFQIHSENATYFYHKRGSAFSSIVDNDGNDWVGYHPEGGPAGSYRGIPNLAPADFHPGPGEGNLESEVVSAGPLKLRILSQTADRKWACTWDIYPTYAKMTLFKTDERPFWLLYEGTPGGSLDAETDYWVHSSGERAALAQDWEGELPAPEWVYFGDGGMRRVLYFIHHEDDTVPDQFFPMQGNMTVFGFGREFKGMGMYLTTVPTHLTIGFAEDGTYLSRAKKVIEGAYKEVKISAGVPEVNGHRHLPGGAER